MKSGSFLKDFIEIFNNTNNYQRRHVVTSLFIFFSLVKLFLFKEIEPKDIIVKYIEKLLQETRIPAEQLGSRCLEVKINL